MRIFIDTDELRSIGRSWHSVADALADVGLDLLRAAQSCAPPPVEVTLVAHRVSGIRTRVMDLAAEVDRDGTRLEQEASLTALREHGGLAAIAALVGVALGAGIAGSWPRWVMPRITPIPPATPGAVPVVPAALEGPQHFPNEKIVDMALKEVGTSRPGRAYGAPGQCVVSVQRWIAAAGGSMPGSPVGPLAAFQAAHATPIPGFAQARPGDVVQITGVHDDSWDYAHVHTFVIVGPGTQPGTYHIVQSNVPYGSGKVSEVPNWRPVPPADGRFTIWRFGQV